jgi:hypothetical protein
MDDGREMPDKNIPWMPAIRQNQGIPPNRQPSPQQIPETWRKFVEIFLALRR